MAVLQTAGKNNLKNCFTYMAVLQTARKKKLVEWLCMQIPSKKQCYQLICNMEMMDHIAAHSVRVCQVAMLLTDHLKIEHSELNRGLVQASALLHDITKTRSFKTGESHAVTGGEFLSSLGYAKVGDIVRQHVQLDKYVVSGTPTETEIVNYADKRVLHDKVVPLGERLDYILEKYGKSPELMERIHKVWKKTDEMEDKLFDGLSFPPEAVSSLLTQEEFSEEISKCRAFTRE